MDGLAVHYAAPSATDRHKERLGLCERRASLPFRRTPDAQTAVVGATERTLSAHGRRLTRVEP